MSITSGTTHSYVSAITEVAEAEGNLERVADELYRFSTALAESRNLYEALSDFSIPVFRRQQIIMDLLEKKADRLTIGLISMIVSVGRIKDLDDIAEELADKVAKRKNREIAFVRTAVELNDQQKENLRNALMQATDKELELKVIVDPNLLGGVVATIGDTIIDGSVKSRLSKLRETMEKK